MSDELDRLEAEVRKAQEHEADLQRQQAEAAARARQIEAELVALAEDDPDQFDLGNPKAKSRAAKLADEVSTLRSPAAPWSQRLDAARERTRLARRDLNAYKSDNLEALAADLEPEARDAVLRIEEALRQVVTETRNYAEVSAALVQLLLPVTGLDGSDMPPSDIAAKIGRDAQRHLSEPIPPPLPRSLFREGRTPPKIRVEGGGFIPIEHATPEQLEAAGLGHLLTTRRPDFVGGAA